MSERGGLALKVERATFGSEVEDAAIIKILAV